SRANRSMLAISLLSSRMACNAIRQWPNNTSELSDASTISDAFQADLDARLMDQRLAASRRTNEDPLRTDERSGPLQTPQSRQTRRLYRPDHPIGLPRSSTTARCARRDSSATRWRPP